MRKGVLLFAFFFMVFALPLVSSIGESCFVTDSTSCTSSGGTAIMGLSSTTNAHGELANQSNYNDVLCCNFAGSLTCTGDNKVLGLSSSTNAHVEIPAESTYTESVCYSDLECINTALTCGETAYPLSVLSLQNFTNTHLGEIGDYSINICCNSQSFIVSSSNTFWSNDTVNEISSLNVVTGTTTVKLVLKNSGLAQETNVNFSIYENDLFLDDLIRTFEVSIDANGSAIVDWMITLEDLEKTLNDYTEFYFEVNNVSSTYLSLNILEVSECAEVVICSHYGAENNCADDNCQVAEITAPNEVDCDGLTSNCYCSWDAVNECNLNVDLIEEETQEVIATCRYLESSVDDCADGFLSFSWTVSWNGDEEDKPSTCTEGSKVVECPARLRLPFFGFYNLIAGFLAIALIYFILSNRKIIKKN